MEVGRCATGACKKPVVGGVEKFDVTGSVSLRARGCTRETGLEGVVAVGGSLRTSGPEVPSMICSIVRSPRSASMPSTAPLPKCSSSIHAMRNVMAGLLSSRRASIISANTASPLASIRSFDSLRSGALEAWTHSRNLLVS